MLDRLTTVGICGDNRVCPRVSRAFEEGELGCTSIKVIIIQGVFYEFIRGTNW